MYLDDSLDVARLHDGDAKRVMETIPPQNRVDGKADKLPKKGNVQ